MEKMMAPYQQRVVDEKTELDGKLAKLTAFYFTALFRELPEYGQSLLLRQDVAMRNYSVILGERIAKF